VYECFPKYLSKYHPSQPQKIPLEFVFSHCGIGYHKINDSGENTGHFTSPNWKKIHPEKLMHKTSIFVPTGQETALSIWKQYPYDQL
jgi:hypothetical protein